MKQDASVADSWADGKNLRVKENYSSFRVLKHMLILSVVKQTAFYNLDGIVVTYIESTLWII